MSYSDFSTFPSSIYPDQIKEWNEFVEEQFVHLVHTKKCHIKDRNYTYEERYNDVYIVIINYIDYII
jgi:hypothetical protein